MKLSQISTLIKTVEYAGEDFINLQDLYNLLNAEVQIEMEDCLITPYYLKDNRRMELYQYEFCCTSECNFEEYILEVTGKKKIEEIPKEIFCLRKNCFATIDESNRLLEFLKFILENKDLQEEVKKTFGNYMVEDLYAIIY